MAKKYFLINTFYRHPFNTFCKHDIYKNIFKMCRKEGKVCKKMAKCVESFTKCVEKIFYIPLNNTKSNHVFSDILLASKINFCLIISDNRLFLVYVKCLCFKMSVSSELEFQVHKIPISYPGITG